MATVSVRSMSRAILGLGWGALFDSWEPHGCGPRCALFGAQGRSVGLVTGRSLLAEKKGGRPVRRPLLLQATILLAAGSLLVSTGCCTRFPGYGTIIRGQWSLECNKVPWLDSREETCEEISGGDCGPGMMLGAPCEGGDVPLACSTAHGCRPGLMGCRTCGHSTVGGPQSQQMGHGRFHPVPTRPVFTPWKCPPAGPAAKPSHGRARQPEQMAPEVIPTPAGTQSRREPTRADSSVASAAWIFRPEEASGPTLAAK